MDRRLVKVVVWLVLLVFLAVQVPNAGAERRIGSRDVLNMATRALAAKLAMALPKILERFRARRQELLARGGGDAYPTAGLAELLDSTEASLRKELKKKDFDPLRDYIAEVFDNARSGLGLPTKTALRLLPAPQATLASLHLSLAGEASGSRLDRSVADRMIAVVDALLADLSARAKGNDLTVDLCVLSDPPKAKVALHTASGRKIDPTKTNGRFTDLVRGNYFYAVSKRGFPTFEERIRVYDKKRPVLDCDLKNNEGCDIEDGWPEACGGR